MIRFMPDTWLDALLRPIAMVAPDAAVYVEFMAPDWRFAFVLILIIFTVLLGWRKKIHQSATTVLLGLVSLSFVSWLATSGNGRYFMPILLAVGPLCIALIYHLPLARTRKMLIALFVISLQSFAVYEADPFWHQSVGAWAKEPFFEMSLHPQMLEDETTYITFTGLSYSLIAPKFKETSRWINVSSQSDVRGDTAEGRRIQSILAVSKTLKLIIPSLSGFMTKQNLPSSELTREINNILTPHRLKLINTESCQLITSKGLARRERGNIDKLSSTEIAAFGFWVCGLTYPVTIPLPVTIVSDKAEKVFGRIEASCPRLFPLGRSSTPMSGGYLRFYPDSDMRVYVFDNGAVYYKYWRVMNPVLIGNVDEILSQSFEMDCNNIRGRSALPWNRQL